MEISGFSAGPFRTNTYVVSGGGRAVVVDPGMHTRNFLVSKLNKEGLAPEAILLTHGHIDHTRDAGDLAAAWQCPVYIHADDAFMLDRGEGVSEQSRQLFDADSMTPIEDLRFFVDGEVYDFVGESFTVRHAPGHSPGSVLLEHAEMVLVGDVVFRGSIGRTDLPHSDDAAMQASLQDVVLPLADSLALLPGHGPTTSMAVERASNPFLIPRNLRGTL
ncbi:MBL fold metallo-hydrolase [Corynebacterium uterequi]|uniref:Zn-dependent hydrolase, glyoxylase n=1 Tax=Corynebacterium uterequi TaxID=1072256 RepID=A0A0G3HH35_9CORY|nr:MBL fold metallo-hydrolase [Corynebacterium uterequi]AKK11228.1 Zn-dependent hydrolase, glyoxylase [Corynebacterium uterequi]